MEAHSIRPLKMPTKYSGPIKLTMKSKLPKQIAEELAMREAVLEVVYFPPAQTEVKSESRIKLKFTDELKILIFYTAT